jgi:hypothetical protein
VSDDLVKQAMAELTDVVRCRCNEAYTGRGLRDPDCQCDSAEAVKVVADRIEELEGKLAKAVTALEFYGGWSDSSGGICGFDGGSRARTTLAELKGQE